MHRWITDPARFARWAVCRGVALLPPSTDCANDGLDQLLLAPYYGRYDVRAPRDN
jgi:hypothetical protein